MTAVQDLPRGWATIPLCQAVQPRNEKVSPSDYPEARFIGMNHVESHSTVIIGSRPASAMKSNAASFRSGDVLYGRLRPYLNKVAQPDFDGLASAEFIVFPDTALIRSHFLKHRLNAADFVSFASHLNEGDRPRVSFDQIGEFEILLPPPSEQHRIVARIEELFSELDKGVENLEKAREQLKAYRQAVLKHAFEGKLTAQWREENKDKLEKPEQLLARIKQERAARYDQQLGEWKTLLAAWEKSGKSGKRPAKPPKLKELPLLSSVELETLPLLADGWSYLRLGWVIDEPKYGTSKKCDYNYEGMGVLRIPNVVLGTVDASDLKGAHFEADEKRTYALRKGDILVIRSNGSRSIVGKCALISEAEEQYLYAGYLIRLRSNPAAVLPEYLATLLSSHLLRTQIEHKAKSTSGVNNINSTEIQSFVVPLCSLSEQEEVIKQLSEHLSAINSAQLEITNQLLKVATLRQSVLKKAFSGQLVAQDPNDEPASVLLERIKAEKLGRSHSAKIRKKRRRAKEAA